LLLIALLSTLALLSFGSLPSRQSLRFYEANAENLAGNAVGGINLLDFSVSSENLLAESVTASKLGKWIVNNEQIAPGAVTSDALSFDIVTLVIKDQNTIVSPGQAYPLPNGVESILPVENVYFQQTIVDSPNVEYAYKVSTFARGPGTIVAWYPSKNAHLLRYQSARALHGIVCIDAQILNIEHTTACDCNEQDVTDFCACVVQWNYESTVWGMSSIFSNALINRGNNFECNTECTSLFGCWDVYGYFGDENNIYSNYHDPQCFRNDPRHNNFDFNGQEPSINNPDRCGSFTSVEDVNNPQEGISVYAPSVESIQIDNIGKVTMSFFGRGSAMSAVGDIEINVVVLLDEQYGA